MGKDIAFTDLPNAIQHHLAGLAAELKKQNDPEYMRMLADVWICKEELFRQQVGAMKLILTDEIPSGDGRGMMVLTYSGSILSIGPVFLTSTNVNFSRWIEYSSIKLRTEVPDIIIEKAANLSSPLSAGKPVLLGNSRVKATSPAYMIAVCPEGLNEEEQDKRIRESAVFITAGFMKYNRSLQIDARFVPDQFTMKSMTRFLAKKHGLTGQEARLIIDDFLSLIETGMLMGESVPFGRLGRFSVKTREAQKPRVVRHPVSGDEMTVKAKPAKGIPKISFSSYMKERAEAVVSEQS